MSYEFPYEIELTPEERELGWAIRTTVIHTEHIPTTAEGTVATALYGSDGSYLCYFSAEDPDELPRDQALRNLRRTIDRFLGE